jgi:hypothetical protein
MSAEPVTVSVASLRAGVAMLLDRVERQFGADVDLAADYYWDLPLVATFDPANDPQGHTLGSLVDDVESLAELLAEDPEDAVVWHDLSHVVGILRRLAALDLP